MIWSLNGFLFSNWPLPLSRSKGGSSMAMPFDYGVWHWRIVVNEKQWKQICDIIYTYIYILYIYIITYALWYMKYVWRLMMLILTMDLMTYSASCHWHEVQLMLADGGYAGVSRLHFWDLVYQKMDGRASNYNHFNRKIWELLCPRNLEKTRSGSFF